MRTKMKDYTKESLEVFLENVAEIAFPNDFLDEQAAQADDKSELCDGGLFRYGWTYPVDCQTCDTDWEPVRSVLHVLASPNVLYPATRLDIEENDIFPVGFRIQRCLCAFV